MRVVIVGGGASGLMAAGTAKNCEILVLERNEKAGKKLYITGKGRCNVTNLATREEFIENVVSNPKFLLSAINNFTPFDTVELLERYGVKTKTERGNRVFPLSDKSSDVIKALVKYAENNEAKIQYNTYVKSVKKENDKFILDTSDGEIICDKLVIATGGKSYPATGSDGSGYELAKQFSHNIITPVPALVPILLKDDVSTLAGLSLKNVNVRIHGYGFDKSEFGEMLFTHYGVSGPVILSLSSLINRKELKNYKLEIDLKPALDYETLDTRILSDFQKFINKQFKNSLSELLPKSLIPYIIRYSGIDGELYVNNITKAQRANLVKSFKALTFSISALERIEAGIVTAGGVDVAEVSPKTMESKLVSGLYFAGEILDIDAFTGGFNIQIALSTGYAAAKAFERI